MPDGGTAGMAFITNWDTASCRNCPLPHGTERGERGGDMTDHRTRQGMGTMTRDLIPELPSLPLPAQHMKWGIFGQTGPDGTLGTGKRSQWGFK